MARKTVLVTGASRGIGKAIAVKFAKKGWNVVISCVKREEQLLQTKKEIESFQVSCLAFLGDMGKMEDCAASRKYRLRRCKSGEKYTESTPLYGKLQRVFFVRK